MLSIPFVFSFIRSLAQEDFLAQICGTRDSMAKIPSQTDS